MVTPKENGCICDVCADRGEECERVAMAPGEDLCLPCAQDDHSKPLWGKDGPAKGQVITIAGTSMQTRWTGTHWELVD